MYIKTTLAALLLTAFAGCTAETTEPADLPTPSEAAKAVNENPTSPTVDVPSTPRDESAPAAPATEPEKGAGAGAEKDAPAVVPSPGDPTPEVKDAPEPEKKEESPE